MFTTLVTLSLCRKEAVFVSGYIALILLIAGAVQKDGLILIATGLFALAAGVKRLRE